MARRVLTTIKVYKDTARKLMELKYKLGKRRVADVIDYLLERVGE